MSAFPSDLALGPPGVTLPHVPTGDVSVSEVAASMKERLAAKRRKLEENTTFELPVPGYEDENLWVRYRSLGFDDVRTIGLQVEAETSEQVVGERLTAADTLVEACVELLEYKGEGSDGKPAFEPLGYKWTAAAARDLFDTDLPAGVGGRDALQAIFPYPRDMLMMNHFGDYLSTSMGYLPQIEEIMRGESQAPSGATRSS